MTIQAIETHYQGYRFRSRLEARWAVFFNHRGIPWRYEAQGYALQAGNYLPDFEIRPGGWECPVLVEVKGDPSGLLRRGSYDWNRIAEISQTFPVLILSDIPKPSSIGGGKHDAAALFPLMAEGQLTCACFVWNENGLWAPVWHNLAKDGQAVRCWAYDVVEDAFEAARSARFEHGENG
jgi:hypothetical protein